MPSGGALFDRHFALIVLPNVRAEPPPRTAARKALDQARLLEGEALPDPQAFARRLEDMMTKGLTASGA